MISEEKKRVSSKNQIDMTMQNGILEVPTTSLTYIEEGRRNPSSYYSSERSSGNDDSSTSDDNFDDESDSVAKNGGRKSTQASSAIFLQSEKEIRSLRIILRYVFNFIFFVFALTVSYILFSNSKGYELQEFENEFAAEGKKLLSSIEQNLVLVKLSSIDSFGTAVSSMLSFGTNQNDVFWPTYIIPNFNELASHSLLSHHRQHQQQFQKQQQNGDTIGNVNSQNMPSVIFAPLVTESTRSNWELFSTKYSSSIAHNIYGSGNLSGRKNNTNNESNVISMFNDETHGPYFPVFQHLPYVQELVNFDLLSHDNFKDDIIAMMKSSEMVIGRILSLNATSILHQYYRSIMPKQTITNERQAEYSVSHIYYPIFDTVSTAQDDNDNKPLVGLFSTTIFWDDLIASAIPTDYDKSGMLVVIRSRCGDTNTDDEQILSYEINGNASTFLGKGDFHSIKFDSYPEAVYFDMQEIEEVSMTSSLDTPMNNKYCPYTIHIYPTEQLRNEYSTVYPMVYVFIPVIVFIIVCASTMIYDYFMHQSMHKLLRIAKQSQAVVKSFFPENVQQRLFEDDNKSVAMSIEAENGVGATDISGFKSSERNQKHVLNDYLDTNTDDPGFNEAVRWKPIADFFPHCTVSFADIAGFTSWSSSREPAQVFTLLQVLFAAFDKTARKDGVFKVETIGDCYLCVTGLPNAQPDHALRMVKFARQCMHKMMKLTKKLEPILGPDTGDLRMRIGLHSGPVTAGVLRGEKSRFQLFGDTVNTASRIESTGEKNRIQISQATADLITAAGKQHWVKPRSDFINAKGKGEMQTYWVVMRSIEKESEAGGSSSDGQSDCDDDSLRDEGGVREGGMKSNTSLLPISRSAKNKRLVSWIVETLKPRIKEIVAQRGLVEENGNMPSVLTSTDKNDEATVTDHKAVQFQGGCLLDEVVESFTAPAKLNYSKSTVEREVELPPHAVRQLHDFVTKVADLYHDNPFHNFEHACHVTMSVDKLLKRVATPDNLRVETGDTTHESKYGITSDALAQFAIIFSALIHDVDHRGVSNFLLGKENPEMNDKYKNRSLAEQNSVELSWSLLMDPEYKDLQKCICADTFELTRFRQLVVNSVLATDIFDKEGKSFREKRWYKAFYGNGHDQNDADDGDATNNLQGENEDLSNLKATIVIEHIIQASDVAHTMQHWKVYTKWNERLFREMYAAFDSGRSSNDPSEGWYKGELWFFDNYVIPLANKLKQCSVFGVAYDECLNHATENRNEWKRKGEKIVERMKDRYHKRKSMEIGGFTDEEISSLTPSDLEYIMRKLIEKGRNNGSKLVDSAKGQNDAAQAWLDALEIWERAPAALEMRDRTIVFPIFSGILIWLKGGKIKQDKDKNFEQNLANIFVRESRLNGDPVHYSRALAMKCEVMCRLGKYDIAFETFDILKSIYDPEKHSLAVAAEFGTDRSMHAFAQSAMWHQQVGNSKEALEMCDYVIDVLLPQMDPTNTLGKIELLLPVFRTLKPLAGQEKRLRDLMNYKIIGEFNKYHGPDAFTPAKPVFKPLLMLFEICYNPGGYPNFPEAVDWLLEDGNCEIPDFVDSIYVNVFWSMHSLTAEICLRFANELVRREDTEKCSEKRKKLIEKGLRMARKGDVKMIDSAGNIIFPIPYEIHEPVIRELHEIATAIGVDIERLNEGDCDGGAPGLSINLPQSYLKPPEKADNRCSFIGNISVE